MLDPGLSACLSNQEMLAWHRFCCAKARALNTHQKGDHYDFGKYQERNLQKPGLGLFGRHSPATELQ